MSLAQGDLGHVRFISAGAGSGKTYRLTELLEEKALRGPDHACFRDRHDIHGKSSHRASRPRSDPADTKRPEFAV